MADQELEIIERGTRKILKVQKNFFGPSFIKIRAIFINFLLYLILGINTCIFKVLRDYLNPNLYGWILMILDSVEKNQFNARKSSLNYFIFPLNDYWFIIIICCFIIINIGLIDSLYICRMQKSSAHWKWWMWWWLQK